MCRCTAHMQWCSYSDMSEALGGKGSQALNVCFLKLTKVFQMRCIASCWESNRQRAVVAGGCRAVMCTNNTRCSHTHMFIQIHAQITKHPLTCICYIIFICINNKTHSHHVSHMYIFFIKHEYPHIHSTFSSLINSILEHGIVADQGFNWKYVFFLWKNCLWWGS